jgi:hypothetical protein
LTGRYEGVKYLRTLAIILGFSASAIGQAPAPGQAEDAWTGTITSVRRGSTTETMDDGGTLRVSTTENVTFTFQGDGTARFTASHNMTMTLSSNGASATTRQFGSDTGWVYASVYHDGPVDPIAQRLLGMKSRWHFGVGNSAIKIRTIMPSAPGFGKLQPDSDSMEFLAGVELYSDDAPGAKALTGSRTRQPGDDLGAITFAHIWPVRMTEQLTWSLTRGPVDPRPRVFIRGPECGCLDADHPDKTPLKFIGAATRRGGEFSEFTVKSDGAMPEIRTNDGGGQAELELVGSKNTGRVTLTLHYTKDGRRYDAQPFTVDFCTIETITLDHNDEHDLSFDLDDMLTVHAKAKTWFNGKESPKQLKWELDKMGSPTTQRTEPPDAAGDDVRIIYENLPEKNSDFGEKKLTAKVSRGSCACEQSDTIRAFYPDIANSHPGGAAAAAPNWYHYWSQTSAVPPAAKPLLKYQQVLTALNSPTADPIGMYDHRTERILIGDGLFSRNACREAVDRATHAPTGRRAAGIDCFGEIIRHEMQHRTDAIDWWQNPKGPYGLLDSALISDADGDFLPFALERSLGCSTDSQKSCPDRPFPDTTDAEINAYWVGWSWPIGSVDAEDWSCGELSKQWHGSKCP